MCLWYQHLPADFLFLSFCPLVAVNNGETVCMVKGPELGIFKVGKVLYFEMFTWLCKDLLDFNWKKPIDVS